MKLQYAIPAVLGVGTTLTACADPIVGEWNGESISVGGESQDIPYEYNGLEVLSSLTMTVESDLTGKWSQEGYYAFNFDINATNDGGGKYTIAIDATDGEETIVCTLSGSSLDCTDEDDGFTVNFSKGAKE
ncbi:MAG: hypothetical protein VX278_09910 [Myxococcota bacterium]|nr:hypothetical protein [Myxococcota bacterium]